MSEKSKRPRRSFSDEFKQDAVDLVVQQGYSFKAAADAVGVSSRSLREWHKKLSPEPAPCDDDASADLLREEIKQLKKRLEGRQKWVSRYYISQVFKIWTKLKL